MAKLEGAEGVELAGHTSLDVSSALVVADPERMEAGQATSSEIKGGEEGVGTAEGRGILEGRRALQGNILGVGVP